MLVVLEHYMKRKTNKINITHLYNFVHQKSIERYKCKISHSMKSLVFELVGFWGVHTQFDLHQQNKSNKSIVQIIICS